MYSLFLIPHSPSASYSQLSAFGSGMALAMGFSLVHLLEFFEIGVEIFRWLIDRGSDGEWRRRLDIRKKENNRGDDRG